MVSDRSPSPPPPPLEDAEDDIDHLFLPHHNESVRGSVRFLRTQFAMGLDFSRVHTLRVELLRGCSTLMCTLLYTRIVGPGMSIIAPLGFLSVRFRDPPPHRTWSREASLHMANTVATAVGILGSHGHLGVFVSQPDEQLERDPEHDNALDLADMVFTSDRF